MAYITDTTADLGADYLSAIKDVDTLIHECNFPDGWEDHGKLTGHSCLTPVAKVAAKVNAKKVYLVHVNPIEEIGNTIDVSTVKDIYSEMEIAEDHLVIDV